MARGKPVVLDTREFATQTLANEHFRKMLGRYRPGDIIDSEDAADLKSLLRRHNESDEKIGVGIDHFEVMSADYGSQCFCVIRTDGTKTDFSYKRCIDQRQT